jgi:nicotinamide-nucleotide amidase
MIELQSDNSSQPAVEVITVGTELLLGQILDTNTQFLTQELAAIGLNCHWHSTVGDNKIRIKECLRIAFERADVLLVTGGLGPTADDLTIECLAEFFEVPMEFSQPVWEDIADKFSQRRLPMPESNRKQALRPCGAAVLPNRLGTAPGIIWKLDSVLLRQAGLSSPERPRYVLTFPGVPSEMTDMWRMTARSFLLETFGSGAIWSLDLKHFGVGESALAELHADLLGLTNPTVAPLAGTGECRLRVTAKAGSLEAAKALASGTIEKVRQKSGSLCYGVDNDTVESVVGAMLTERALSLAVAESCTGGLVSKRLTDVPGSSRYTKLNLVAYADQSKRDFLAVEESILAAHGAVSAECAYAMADGVRRLSDCDLGLAVTGIAGPAGGTQDKPVGLVFIALVSERFRCVKKLSYSSSLSRTEIRQRTANEALNMVRLYLIDPGQLTNK